MQLWVVQNQSIVIIGSYTMVLEGVNHFHWSQWTRNLPQLKWKSSVPLNGVKGSADDYIKNSYFYWPLPSSSSMKDSPVSHLHTQPTYTLFLFSLLSVGTLRALESLTALTSLLWNPTYTLVPRTMSETIVLNPCLSLSVRLFVCNPVPQLDIKPIFWMNVSCIL